MKRPLKLLSGVLFIAAIAGTLFILLPESPVLTDKSDAAENTAVPVSVEAVESGSVARKTVPPVIESPAKVLKPLDQSQDSGGEGDSLEDYTWVPDPKIKGGIRSIRALRSLVRGIMKGSRRWKP